MVTLQSGHIETNTNTPSGLKKKVAVDRPYITKDLFISTIEAQGLGIDATSPIYLSGELDKVILRASAWINRICRRYMHTQTIDETKTGFFVRPFNPQLVTVVLANPPYQKINRITIQVLKWFIDIDVNSSSSYLQDFPDFGYYKIVPMLSTSGTGAGSPIPAAILDHVMLGVIWTNYTFGYGTPLTAQTLTCTDTGTYKNYQAIIGNRLFAFDQTLNVYKNGTLQAPNTYTVDFANGIITFSSAKLITDIITADFTTDESIPADIAEACILLVAHMIGQATANPLGVSSLSLNTVNISWGDKSSVKSRVMELLESYIVRLPKII